VKLFGALKKINFYLKKHILVLCEKNIQIFQNTSSLITGQI